MRVFIMFDLPVETAKQRKSYRHFRKYLINEGFIQEQYSVYSKLVQNSAAADAVSAKIRKNKPPEGVVQLFCITEKQYAKMEFIVGESKNDIVATTERFIVL
ncbi:MAG: CRISPR-associated endonuclease Cas2 [Peptococcaceae bacterium]|nr:CRISPR-associated endonuclease Cas2 [Peptococcaceae bacterium]